MATKFSPDMSMVLAFSKEEAERLLNGSVTPTHILLAMLRHKENNAVQILRTLHTDLQALKSKLEESTKESRMLIAPNTYDMDFDLAIRQTLLGQKLSLGLVAHDVLHTARYHSRRHTDYLLSETWVRPQYPSITLSVAYRFRQASNKQNTAKALSHDAEFTGKDF